MDFTTPLLIRKILVANRGEIAIRVLRAATELDIHTIAIYTYEDRYSLHRYKADEAYQIGEKDDPLKPYLNIEEIIALAKATGADAIHPGYGFLSENVQFAKRCEESGIIFIGPNSEVMARLGDKISAKKLAAGLQIPLIESSQVSLTTAETALSEAERIGFPVIIKASAGGGGRGMRVIRNPEHLIPAYHEAQREALNAFGDSTVFIEKYVENPKHIEVQILGDKSGNIVHLFERDCSVQRRFQKVVEVAPAPNLSQAIRQLIYGYALKIARSVNYYNAGTVEFLVDQHENVYFIEVNPRIQVEHTVTEVVTGIDIVRSQILIAAGLDFQHPQIYIPNQSSIRCNGFAIQCRITTEDPENQFKPDFGRIIAYRNAGGLGVRLDEGSSYPGVQISPFFDSMLVKVTTSGRTLKGACQRMIRTLREFRIRGVKTNIPFLQNVVNHKSFQKGQANVNFIETHPELFEFVKYYDRGTRTIQYLAEITVNGNPDVGKISPPVFQNPIIPSYNRFENPSSGTKQLLTELGPDKFAAWLCAQKEVFYTDTTLRDAHQSLLATRVRTIDMLSVAESFAHHHPNLFSMEVWGGATFDVSMRFLHEDPWKRLQALRKAVPNMLLQMLTRGSNAVGYAAYPDNLIEKFIEKSWENGIDVFRIFDSLNWLEGMKVSIQAVRKYTGGLAEACICYTGDIFDKNRPKYNLNYYLDLAKRLQDEGAHILGIKDMAGLLKPYSAETLIGELKQHISIPIHLHTHDTSSVQCATYLKAIEAGVHVVDVALASMSGLTSQPNFNSIVEMLKGTPRENPVNIQSLNRFSDYWENVREYYFPFESGLKAGTAEVYVHEIPGGQYSNLKPQAASLGLLEKWETIKNNFKVVNELFGDIVKVTPSSKVVGDMALYMTAQNLTADDIFNKGETLSFPESVKGLFRGEIGQPEGGFPITLQKIILKDEAPFTDRPNAHLKPINFDSDFEQFQQQFGKETAFEDYLSYQFYPKVFQEYHDFQKQFGDLSFLPTPQFLYGLKQDEETVIEIEPGKTIIVKLLYIETPDKQGFRLVHFMLNGQDRSVRVRDKSVLSVEKLNEKADANNPYHIASPLQGKLAKILVQVGDKVEKNQAIFIVEAMKMETTVVTSISGIVAQLKLSAGSLLTTGDLVATLKE